MQSVVGLDIGGANLKAAHSRGQARSLSFPLWKEPGLLGERIQHLVAQLPPAEGFALTMTGELCDCFADQASGVRFILESARQALAPAPIQVWSLDGVFVTVEEAKDRPARVAAANWLAQATLVARLVSERPALLIDVGSTTTDLVPLIEGKPAPTAFADPERLRSGELVYTGARRTPVCAVLGAEVAAEFFATMDDVTLVLKEAAPRPEDRDTADGRPATMEHAHARLARMLCADPGSCPRDVTLELARTARARQASILEGALDKVETAMGRAVEVVVTSGSGAFVLRDVRMSAKRLSLAERWGEEISACACAWAVATLVEECRI